MKISVVIPTLNEEKYVENTLRSLRNQDYEKKFEIIVADSSSKDNTRNIAKKYARVVDVEERGFSVGRNAGAKVAKGDVVLFIDADTVAAPNFLSEVDKAFTDPSTVGATCSTYPMTNKLYPYLIFWFANMWFKRKIEKGNPQAAGTALAVKKEAFDRVGGFDENVGSIEDVELCTRMKSQGKFVWMSKTFVLTSARRIERWGFFKSIRMYAGNYLKMKWGKKSGRFEAIR